MNILQPGSGSPRPAVIVYHSRQPLTLPANVLVANETRTDHYPNVASLAETVASLSAQVGSATLSPVILAGFSEGGLVTKRLLDAGADPDALVIADGTYGTDYASWTKYANRARARQRAMIASYSAGTASPWQGLKAVTGFPLLFGTALYEPMKYEDGSLVVLGYPDGDHAAQGAVVLPKMINAALDATVRPIAPRAAASSVSDLVAVGAIVAAGGLLLIGGIYIIHRSAADRRPSGRVHASYRA